MKVKRIITAFLLLYSYLSWGQESVKDYFFQEGATYKLYLEPFDSDWGPSLRYYVYSNGILSTVVEEPLVSQVQEPGMRYPSRVVYQGEIARTHQTIKATEESIIWVLNNNQEVTFIKLPDENEIVQWTVMEYNVQYKCSARIKYVRTSSIADEYKRTIKVIKKGPYRTTVYYWAKGEGLLCVWDRDNKDTQMQLIEAVRSVDKKSFRELSDKAVDELKEWERKEKALREQKDFYQENPDLLKNLSSTLCEKIDSILCYYTALHIAKGGEAGTIKLNVDIPQPHSVYILRSGISFNSAEIESIHQEISSTLKESGFENRTVIEPISGETITVGVVQYYELVCEKPRVHEVPVKLKKGSWEMAKGKKVSIPDSWISLIPIAAEKAFQKSGSTNNNVLSLVGVTINGNDYIFASVPGEIVLEKSLVFVGRVEGFN